MMEQKKGEEGTKTTKNDVIKEEKKNFKANHLDKKK